MSIDQDAGAKPLLKPDGLPLRVSIDGRSIDFWLGEHKILIRRIYSALALQLQRRPEYRDNFINYVQRMYGGDNFKVENITQYAFNALIVDWLRLTFVDEKIIVDGINLSRLKDEMYSSSMRSALATRDYVREMTPTLLKLRRHIDVQINKIFDNLGEPQANNILQREIAISESKSAPNLPNSVRELQEKYGTRIAAGNFTMTELNSLDRKLYMSLYQWARRGNDLSRFIPLGKGTPGSKRIDDRIDLSTLDPNDPRDRAYLDLVRRRADARARMKRNRAKASPK